MIAMIFANNDDKTHYDNPVKGKQLSISLYSCLEFKDLFNGIVALHFSKNRVRKKH